VSGATRRALLLSHQPQQPHRLRLFDPALMDKPVVVLSNNDGCIISRSEEAKALGIPMGAPLHEQQEVIRKHGVRVFSSNYTRRRHRKDVAELSSQIEQLRADVDALKKW